MASPELLKLRELFAQLTSGKMLDVATVFEEAVNIFEALVRELEGASLEKKQEILSEMQEVGNLLSKETAILYEKAGMSEEEVSTRSESSQYFSEESWRLVQYTRQRLNDLASKSAKVLKTSILGEKAAPKPTAPSARRPPKSTKRSDWLKS
ncbi:MAG: hypothetical protein ACHQT8_05180 [Chlamydiales bacterium]